MKKIHPSGQFKKDFKKFRRYPDKVKAFEKIVDMLINGLPIPKEHKPHPLKGNYKDCMECHIGSRADDYLLIWAEGDIIDLIRIGSHSELYD